MVKPFERQSSRKVLETPIFDLREDVATHPVTGAEAPYVVLESPDWVNVVAVTEAGEFVLVRQWRHGTRTVELEFPAGLVDEGESPIEAAARELREETGYVAQSMTIIGEVAPNAAFQDNVCTTVLAEGCRKVAEQSLDGGEDIEVLVVPESGIRDLFRAGKLRNGMVGVALMWWCDHTGRTVWR